MPSLYKLELGLPKAVDHKEARSFYDCKIRRLFVILPILPEEEEVAAEPIVFEEERIVEIKEDSEEAKP